jgi:CNT family concentrative nucleoside transporter
VERAVSGLGLLVFIGLAVAASRNRKAIDWRMVGASLAIQVVLAVLLLKTTQGQVFFAGFGQLVTELMHFSDKGGSFVFGSLADPGGPWHFVFAVKVLPTIIFFASLMNVLYYLGVMQFVVAQISKVMRRLLRTSGAETLCASANIFMGQTESPLLIRPYVAGLTQSELMVVMVSGFATLAGGVMFVYAGMLEAVLKSAPGHILTASVLSAPAAIMMAKIIMPETEQPATSGDVELDMPRNESNVIEAAASGASTGLHLALTVAAMLIAFISLVALINGGLAMLAVGLAKVHIVLPATFHSLQGILGLIFAPLAWLLGMSSQDITVVGSLLGQGLVINEFVAYTELLSTVSEGGISPRAATLTIYALCGFTNLSSVGIQIGGIGALAEKRKGDLARLGFLALFAATLANLQTAALAGLLIKDEAFLPPAVTASPAPTSTPQASPMAESTATPQATLTP